jgi:hypothetical protein
LSPTGPWSAMTSNSSVALGGQGMIRMATPPGWGDRPSPVGSSALGQGAHVQSPTRSPHGPSSSAPPSRKGTGSSEN